MIDFMTSIFSSEKHPVGNLKPKHKDAYLRGLGALLSLFAQDNCAAKLAYGFLCRSIVGVTLDDGWSNDITIKFSKGGIKASSLNGMHDSASLKKNGAKVHGLKTIKNALALKRKGLTT